MNKIIMNIIEFGNYELDYSKYFTAIFTFFCSFYYITLYPIISNPYFIVILTLITLDTLLGSAKALKEKDFKTTRMLSKSALKVLEYGIYTAVTLLVGKAPLPLIVVPITCGLITYMIVKEASSVMRITSNLFSNPEMSNASHYIDDIADSLFKRIQDGKTSENPEQPPQSEEP